MRAIAMSILFLRKMSNRMMMTSTMARIITKEGDVRENGHMGVPTLLQYQDVSKGRLCTDWRPAMFVWFAGRLRNQSGNPVPVASHRRLALLSGQHTPCSNGRYLNIDNKWHFKTGVFNKPWKQCGIIQKPKTCYKNVYEWETNECKSSRNHCECENILKFLGFLFHIHKFTHFWISCLKIFLLKRT